MKKNPILFWLFVVFAIVNIADIITAKFILPGEANPLYLIGGSFLFVVIFKVLVVSGLGFYIIRNIYPSNFILFTTINIVLVGTILITLGVASNVYGIMNPEVITEAASVSKGEKISAYMTFMGFVYMIPLMFSLIGFWIYEKVQKKARIDNEYFSKRPWYNRW